MSDQQILQQHQQNNSNSNSLLQQQNIGNNNGNAIIPSNNAHSRSQHSDGLVAREPPSNRKHNSNEGIKYFVEVTTGKCHCIHCRVAEYEEGPAANRHADKCDMNPAVIAAKAAAAQSNS